MLVNKMSQPNSCTKCVVNTCSYYMPGDHCTAEKISIKKGLPDKFSSTGLFYAIFN